MSHLANYDLTQQTNFNEKKCKQAGRKKIIEQNLSNFFKCVYFAVKVRGWKQRYIVNCTCKIHILELWHF